MYCFSEEQVLDHYIDRTRAEVDVIQSQATEITEQFDLMPSTRSLMRKYGADLHEKFFYLSKKAPSPLLGLVLSLQLDINKYPDEMKDSAAMLDSFVLPALDTVVCDETIYARQAKPVDISEACVRTEARFIGALKQVNSRAYHFQNRISVTVDKTGSPVLFRKRSAESTALTLCNLQVGERTFPAGTVVDIRDNHDKDPTHTTQGKLSGHSEILEVYDLPDDFTAAPVRLSPWAFDDPLDRAIFGMSGGFTRSGTGLQITRDSSFQTSRAEIAQAYSIGDFRNAANQVLLLCGADVPVAA